MSKLFLILILLLSFAVPSLAYDPPIAATNWQLTVPVLDKVPTQFISDQTEIKQATKKKLWDWKLITAIGINHLTTELDRRSTYAVFDRCATCTESNPILKKLINNRPATILYMHGLAVLGDGISIWLKSKNVKIWFMPIAVNSSLHTMAKFHNDGVR